MIGNQDNESYTENASGKTKYENKSFILEKNEQAFEELKKKKS